MKIFSRADAMKYTKDGMLEIPEGFTDLDADFAYFVVREDLPKVHTVAIPKTVEHIDTMRGDCSQGPFGIHQRDRFYGVSGLQNECSF